MYLPNAGDSIRKIENNLKSYQMKKNYHSMEIKFQINFDGKTAFEGSIVPEERCIPDIIEAIRNNKDPVMTISQLINIGAKEIYSIRYKQCLQKYFRKER